MRSVSSSVFLLVLLGVSQVSAIRIRASTPCPDPNFPVLSGDHCFPPSNDDNVKPEIYDKFGAHVYCASLGAVVASAQDLEILLSNAYRHYSCQSGSLLSASAAFGSNTQCSSAQMIWTKRVSSTNTFSGTCLGECAEGTAEPSVCPFSCNQKQCDNCVVYSGCLTQTYDAESNDYGVSGITVPLRCPPRASVICTKPALL